ncbi:hypothetical protein [Sulfurimonas sp.]|uniref:hypothetical protein n=1 Tax=Sulfurimonas sp. TaxID=2022749 RepID=UPI0025E51142|nr:hypothetical protein [Sulfurimonas sp.]MDD5158303.1 hypothetical protein [Sulfurimonas sp.]
MKKIVLIWLFLFSALFAISDTESNADLTSSQSDIATTLNKEESSLEQAITLEYKKIPSRALKGEIIRVTVKALPLVDDFTNITYEITGSIGVKLLSKTPTREVEAKNHYDTFYFLVTDTNARLPDFEASLLSSGDKEYKKTTLFGEELDVIALNPKKDFANIVADSFEISSYKTTSYDALHNIVVFIAAAQNCYISSFKLKDVFKQGVESITESNIDSKITYYAIIDKSIDNFSFSYFNLVQNKFVQIDIPIVVNDDSVTTQSDLQPIDHSHEQLKMSLATIVALIIFFVVIWKKKPKYLVLILIPIIYIALLAVPSKDVCIKKGSKVYLLPINNGTIFETTDEEYNLSKEGQTKNWTKIQLNNKKIGWVKDEDICKN